MSITTTQPLPSDVGPIGRACANVPGITSAFTSIGEIAPLAKAVWRAHILDDKEAKLDLSLKLTALPMCIAFTVTSVCDWLIRFNLFFHISTFACWCVSLSVTCLGLAVCFFENLFETLSFKRAAKLRRQLQKRTPEEALKMLIEKQLQLSTKEKEKIDAFIKKKHPDASEAKIAELKEALYSREFKRKYSQLARRIEPWAVKKLYEISTLNHEERVEKTDRLYKAICAQTEKKMLIHFVGILAFITCSCSFFFLYFNLPIEPTSTLFGLCFALSIAKQLLSKTVLHTEGWKFSWKKQLDRQQEVELQEIKSASG